jgi:thiosulfate/3-mercaptopyruvate sulfurtransferase
LIEHRMATGALPLLNDFVPDPLVSAGQLADLMGTVGIYDVRWSLADPEYGISAYRSGHIPGAVFVDLDTDLSSAHGAGRHPLPRVDDFTSTLGRLGIGSGDRVVVYDDSSGSVAARLWWMLTSIGHQDVAVLDGGIQSWIRSGGSLEVVEAQPQPVRYPRVVGFTGVVDHTELHDRVVLDVRSPDRYRGDYEPVDPKAGHIPGAVNLPLAGNVADDGLLRSSPDLAGRYAPFPDDVVVSCGSGVNACQAALAMSVAGRRVPDVYVGSFSDWSRLDLPVSVGPEP